MNAKHSKEEVLAVEYSILAKFARENSIEIPPGTDKAALLELLTKTEPERLNQLQRPCLRFDLQHTEDSLSHRLEEEISGLQKEISKDIEDEVSHISRRIATTDERIKDLRGLFTLTGTAVGVLATLATFLGAYNVIDLSQERDSFENLRGEIAINVEELEGLTRASRRILINEIIDDTEEAFLTFSTSLADPELQDQLETNAQIIRDLLTIYESFPTDSADADQQTSPRQEDHRLLQLLDQSHRGLLEAGNIAMTTKDLQSQTLNSASARFQKIDLEISFANGQYEKFRDRLGAYIANALGVIELRRYRYIQKSDKYLEVADGYFDKAIAERIAYARPYSNKMVVITRRLNKLRKDASPEVLQLLLDRGHEYLDIALGYSESSRNRSIILNNKAFLFLKEAEIYRQIEPSRAATALREARLTVIRGKRLRNHHPVLHTTHAEILAVGIVNEDRARGQEVFADILNLVSLACEQGYVYSEDFIADNPAYENIHLLSIESWRETLEETARNCSGRL